MNDDADIVETAREAGGRHRGRLALRIVKEEDDFTKFHNDHVENNTVDGMERSQAQSRRSESSSTETMSDVAVATARMPGEEHSDRNTAKVVSRAMVITEAGSIVVHVSNSMNEVKKDDEDSEDGEEEGGTAAARESDEISKKVVEIRRLIELRRSTPKEEKQRVKELSKSIKKSIRDKKRLKRQQVIQKCLEDFKGVSSIPGIKSAKKKVLVTKINNERGDIITSRKGIANVFGEFYKQLYDENEQDEYGNESNKSGTQDPPRKDESSQQPEQHKSRLEKRNANRRCQN